MRRLRPARHRRSSGERVGVGSLRNSCFRRGHTAHGRMAARSFSQHTVVQMRVGNLGNRFVVVPDVLPGLVICVRRP